MNYQDQASRRAAVWRIIRSRGTDQGKVRELAELAKPKPRRVLSNEYRRTIGRPSALQAGLLRRVGEGRV